MTLNRIITRGMGLSVGGSGRGGMVTQGYGGHPPPFVVEAFRQQIRLGQSGTKRRIEQLEEVVIWAKLIEVNGRPSAVPIKGWVKAKVDKKRGRARVEYVVSRSRAVWEFIKVNVQRVK